MAGAVSSPDALTRLKRPWGGPQIIQMKHCSSSLPGCARDLSRAVNRCAANLAFALDLDQMTDLVNHATHRRCVGDDPNLIQSGKSK